MEMVYLVDGLGILNFCLKLGFILSVIMGSSMDICLRDCDCYIRLMSKYYLFGWFYAYAKLGGWRTLGHVTSHKVLCGGAPTNLICIC